MQRDKIEQRGRAEQDRVTHDPWEEAFLRLKLPNRRSESSSDG